MGKRPFDTLWRRRSVCSLLHVLLDTRPRDSHSGRATARPSLGLRRL